MAGNLGSLVVKLALDAAEFTDGLTKQERKAQQFGRRIGDSINGAAMGFVRLKATMGIVAFAIAAPLKLLDQMAKEMDVLSKASQRAMMPTEEFSALAYAGGLADVSMETLQKSMGKLSKAQSDAVVATSTQAQAFEALDIKIKNADGSLKSSSEVFMDFADKFKKFGATPEMMAAGLTLFGKGFQEMIPLMQGGSVAIRKAMEEAKALGLVLGTEAGKQAEEFRDNITRLEAGLKGLKREVVSESLPAMIALTDAFVDIAKSIVAADRAAADIGKKSAIKEWAEGTAIAIATLYESLAFIVKGIEALSSSVTVIFNDLSLAGEFVMRGGLLGLAFEENRKALKASLERRNADLEEANRRRAALFDSDLTATSRYLRARFDEPMSYRVGAEKDATYIPPRAKPRAILSDTAKSGSGVTDPAKYLENLKKQTEAARDLSTEEQLLADIQAGRLGKLTPAMRENLTVWAQLVDAIKLGKKETEEYAKAVEKQLADEAQARVSAGALAGRYLEEGQAKIDALVAGNASLRDEINLIGADATQRAKMADALIAEQIARRELDLAMARNIEGNAAEVAMIETELRLLKQRRGMLKEQGVKEKIQEDADAVQKYAERAAENMQNYLGQGLYDMMSGNFDNIGDAFVSMVNRMVAEAAAANLAKYLLGDMVKGGSGSGVLGNLFKAGLTAIKGVGAPAAAGNGSAGLTVLPWGYASGGQVGEGLFRVNEKRTEMLSVNGKDYLMSGSAGRIRPNPVLSGTNGGASSPIQVTIVTPDVASFQRSEGQVASSIGGALARARRFN